MNDALVKPWVVGSAHHTLDSRFCDLHKPATMNVELIPESVCGPGFETHRMHRGRCHLSSEFPFPGDCDACAVETGDDAHIYFMIFAMW